MFEIGRREQLIILILVAALLFGAGYRYAQYKTEIALEPVLVSAPVVEQKPEPKELVVHVSGAVERPGVYRLLEGSRVINAVELAGPRNDADLDRINLAAPLMDGQPIAVPVKMGDTSITPGATPFNPGSSVFGGSKININNANQSQLEGLPGIGPALAQRIIDYRETNGYFRSIEDIQNVSGIGVKKYDSIKDLISVY